MTCKVKSSHYRPSQEAAYIHAGSSAAVMGMASATQNDLWKSIEDSNFGQYYRISESMGMTSGKQEKRRHSLPVRVFIRNGQGLETLLVEVIWVLSGLYSSHTEIMRDLKHSLAATLAAVPCLKLVRGRSILRSIPSLSTSKGR